LLIQLEKGSQIYKSKARRYHGEQIEKTSRLKLPRFDKFFFDLISANGRFAQLIAFPGRKDDKFAIVLQFDEPGFQFGEVFQFLCNKYQ
jgi:hypothetical protein